MENRFGVKDFFLFLVLTVLIVLVALAMEQYDRQWTVIHQTSEQLSELTSDVSKIRQALEQGGGATVTGPANPANMYVGFERVLKSHSQPDYAEGGDLVLVTQALPDRLTPLINEDVLSQIIQNGFVMDTLAGNDPNTLAWVPSLALSWKVSDDLLTIDIALRHGVTFSDGQPFTADDVVYTFELCKNPAIEAPALQSYFDTLTKVEKIDDYHVRFHFSEPYFRSLDTILLTPIMSKAFYSRYSPAEFNTSTGLLIGTGPWRLEDPTSWRPEPGKPIVLVRNERYFGPRPSFNRIIWKVIENASARMTAFENGDVDGWCIQDMGPNPEQFKEVLANPKLIAHTQHFAIDSPLQGYFYLAWNEKKGRDGPPSYFADARVRRAMTMLIDREAIIKNILYGYGRVAVGHFHPLSDQADPTIKPWPYDPAAAMKLLSEAGFAKQGDRLYGPDGKPFVFKLMYPSIGSVTRRCVPLIHDNLAKAGIEMDPDPQEWAVVLQRQDDRQYDAAFAGWGGTLDDDPHQEFDSSQMAGKGSNFVQYSSKDADATIRLARVTRDDAKRAELWRKFSQILHEEQPYTFLFVDQEMDLVDSHIHGVEATRLGINSPEEWYIPKALQKNSE
jgi:peptide/nickel transport system substrate-binding protein